MNRKHVEITGMGIFSSIGQGILDFQHALAQGRAHFTKHEQTIMSYLEPFNLKEALQHNCFFSEKQIIDAIKMSRKSGKSIPSAIMACTEAWKHAKLDEIGVTPERISCIIAGNNTTTQLQQSAYTTYSDEPLYLSPTYALQFMDTYQLGVISELFNIQGEGLTVGGASASGNLALIEGARMILSGCTDICVIIGSLAELSPVEIQGFINVGAMGGKKLAEQPEQACRPFDIDHEGFIYGQTSACIILESVASAKQRKIKPLASIKGFSSKLTPTHLTEPSEITECKVMQAAIEHAGYKTKDIQYINTHGSSSPLGDVTEVIAIKSLFGTVCNQVWLNATKSITGHCLWSAGIVETIATIIQMQHGFLHPNLNLDHPIDTDCHFVGKKSVSAEINLALTNSFGFSGIHSSILLAQ